MSDQGTLSNVNDLKQWSDDIVCPVCHAALRFGAATVVCSDCARTYPIVDGIPVLIPQRAIQPTK